MEPADLRPDLEVEGPDPQLPADHQRPEGLDDASVAALGTLTDAMERLARDQLADGKRHLREAELKLRRVTPGRPGHEITPTDGTS